MFIFGQKTPSSGVSEWGWLPNKQRSPWKEEEPTCVQMRRAEGREDSFRNPRPRQRFVRPHLSFRDSGGGGGGGGGERRPTTGLTNVPDEVNSKGSCRHLPRPPPVRSPPSAPNTWRVDHQPTARVVPPPFLSLSLLVP